MSFVFRTTSKEPVDCCFPINERNAHTILPSLKTKQVFSSENRKSRFYFHTHNKRVEGGFFTWTPFFTPSSHSPSPRSRASSLYFLPGWPGRSSLFSSHFLEATKQLSRGQTLPPSKKQNTYARFPFLFSLHTNKRFASYQISDTLINQLNYLSKKASAIEEKMVGFFLNILRNKKEYVVFSMCIIQENKEQVLMAYSVRIRNVFTTREPAGSLGAS